MFVQCSFIEIVTLLKNLSFIVQIKKKNLRNIRIISQPAITCSKLTTEALEQGVKYVQS